VAQRLRNLRERWQDPLLTVLTILLALLIFVLAPLRAEHIPGIQELAFGLVALVTGAVLVLSGRPVAIGALLLAIILAGIAAIHRLQHPSSLDVYLAATAWLLFSLALILEVGRTTFGLGRVTYHRVMGAILLYFAIGLAFAALFSFIGVASDKAVLRLCCERQRQPCGHDDLLQLRSADRHWLRRHHRAASHRAQSHPCRGYDWTTLSSHVAGAHRDT
jgi:hypothetical protein